MAQQKPTYECPQCHKMFKNLATHITKSHDRYSIEIMWAENIKFNKVAPGDTTTKEVETIKEPYVILSKNGKKLHTIYDFNEYYLGEQHRHVFEFITNYIGSGLHPTKIRLFDLEVAVEVVVQMGQFERPAIRNYVVSIIDP